MCVHHVCHSPALFKSLVTPPAPARPLRGPTDSRHCRQGPPRLILSRQTPVLVVACGWSWVLVVAKLTQQRTSLLEHMVFRGQWWFWHFHCGCVRHQHTRKWSVFDRTNLTKITKQNDTVLWSKWRGISTHSPWCRDFLVLDFFGFLCCPSGFSTVLFYYLLVLYRAVTQNVQPARTLYIHDMWVTRSRASSQACKCSCGKGD